jgi:hypothetical protein
MVYMFNELSLIQVNSISDARNVLEAFVKSSIKAKEFGFTEIRLHENSLQNLYQLSLCEEYRIDNWLSDKEVNSDLKDRFKEIITTFPLITNEEISEKEIYESSEFFKIIDSDKHRVFGLGAAYVYGTLATSIATHQEWCKSSVFIEHFSISYDGNESTTNVQVFNFSSKEILETHKKWIETEQKDSLGKSIDLWDKREEYFSNILFGNELENQLQKIGLTKKFYQIIDCLKKLDAFAKTWNEGGFNLNELKTKSLMNISGESDCTMKKYFLLRKFRLSDGQKAQFELHIKIPDARIYFLPNELTHKITVGYIGKHLRTCLYD